MVDQRREKAVDMQGGFSERELEHFRALLQKVKDEILDEIREMRDPATGAEYA